MVTRKILINIYRLPFDKPVNPLPEPAPYHKENKWLKYALDFAMPEGTPILAAAKGTVYSVVDKYKKGGPEKSLAQFCNRIIIKDSNGEYTDYVHLKEGCKVKEGEKVMQGEIIGYSGLTGYVTYPHLHFAVIKPVSTGSWETVIPKFKINNRVKEIIFPKDS